MNRKTTHNTQLEYKRNSGVSAYPKVVYKSKVNYKPKNMCVHPATALTPNVMVH